MSRSIMVFALFVMACAHGGQSADSDAPAKTDAPPAQHDAATTATNDAPMQNPDAFVPTQDAFVPPADAASALICSSDSECTNAGECCITLGGSTGLCGKGVIVFGACVPQ